MKKISTTKTPKLIRKRRSGNTTRQINFAIDKIFEGFEVTMVDHSYMKNKSETLFHKVLKRLELEHNLGYLIENDKIIIDHKNFKIRLCTVKK